MKVTLGSEPGGLAVHLRVCTTSSLLPLLSVPAKLLTPFLRFVFVCHLSLPTRRGF